MTTAITGGIGSGKSYVCRLLQQRGIEVFNCDLVAKSIIATHPDVRAELTALISAEAAATPASNHAATPALYSATRRGTQGEPPASAAALTKESLGTYLRASAANAARVNAIVHPRVAEAFVQSGMEWMECAILFESGFDRLVDRVVVVTCPEEERIRRITCRDHYDRATALRWLSLQMTDEERLARAAAHNEAAHNAAAHNETTVPSASAEAPCAAEAHNAAEAPRAFHIVNDGITPIEPQLDALLTAL